MVALEQHFPNQQQQYGNGRKKSGLHLKSNSNNNAAAALTTSSAATTTIAQQHNHHHAQQYGKLKQQQQQQMSNNKTAHDAAADNNGSAASEDDNGEQPAKFLKVFNSGSSGGVSATAADLKTTQNLSVQKLFLTTAGNNKSNETTAIFNGSTVKILSTAATTSSLSSLTPSSSSSSPLVTIVGGSVDVEATANELCRLPGGAELNILASNSSIGGNGLKSTTIPTSNAFANGKITFINGISNVAANNPTKNNVNATAPAAPTTTTSGIFIKGKFNYKS